MDVHGIYITKYLYLYAKLKHTVNIFQIVFLFISIFILTAALHFGLGMFNFHLGTKFSNVAPKFSQMVILSQAAFWCNALCFCTGTNTNRGASLCITEPLVIAQSWQWKFVSDRLITRLNLVLSTGWVVINRLIWKLLMLGLIKKFVCA